MPNYFKYIAFAISLMVIKLRTKKDLTAQGVAKVRHCESIIEDESRRLYNDPYAEMMFSGSSIQTWLGAETLMQIYDWFIPGFFGLLTLRTKFIDDRVVDASNAGIQQLVILGAGYDTRGFRLELPDDFKVVEVDQTSVQTRKKKILETIAVGDSAVSNKMFPGEDDVGSSVEFLDIDFNTDVTLTETLMSSTSLELNQPAIVTLEGVTQYIPKESTAKTLKEIHEIFPEGSLLVVSYCPQAVLDNPVETIPVYPSRMAWMLTVVEWTGEPWISFWNPPDFESFVGDCGFEVVSHVGAAELNQQYLVPRNRGMTKDNTFYAERYVVARVVKKN